MKKYIQAAEDFYENYENLSIKDKEEIGYSYLLTYEIATEDEIDLVANINGWNYDTYCDILYARTGYRDFDQLDEDEVTSIADSLGIEI